MPCAGRLHAGGDEGGGRGRRARSMTMTSVHPVRVVRVRQARGGRADWACAVRRVGRARRRRRARTRSSRVRRSARCLPYSHRKPLLTARSRPSRSACVTRVATVLAAERAGEATKVPHWAGEGIMVPSPPCGTSWCRTGSPRPVDGIEIRHDAAGSVMLRASWRRVPCGLWGSIHRLSTGTSALLSRRQHDAACVMAPHMSCRTA